MRFGSRDILEISAELKPVQFHPGTLEAASTAECLSQGLLPTQRRPPRLITAFWQEASLWPE
jgi:hypothetical protein